MTIQEKNIEIDNLNWFYREGEAEGEGGDKTPVVLLHGLLSQSFSWLEIMPVLSEYGYNCIAPDWIGWGLSDKPEKRDFAYTPEAFYEGLSKFIDRLEFDKISLVVQGYLATIGIQYALKNPEKIDRLVILNSPIYEGVKLPWQIAQCGAPFMGEMVTQDPLIVDRTLEKGSGFVISDNNLYAYRKPIVTSSAAGRMLVVTVRKLKLKQITQEIAKGLKSYSQPCLIIWGEDDPWLSIEPVESLAKANKTIKLTPLPEAKHYPQEHFSKEIAPMIVNFLGSN